MTTYFIRWPRDWHKQDNLDVAENAIHVTERRTDGTVRENMFGDTFTAANAIMRQYLGERPNANAPASLFTAFGKFVIASRGEKTTLRISTRGIDRWIEETFLEPLVVEARRARRERRP